MPWKPLHSFLGASITRTMPSQPTSGNVWRDSPRVGGAPGFEWAEAPRLLNTLGCTGWLQENDLALNVSTAKGRGARPQLLLCAEVLSFHWNPAVIGWGKGQTTQHYCSLQGVPFLPTPSSHTVYSNCMHPRPSLLGIQPGDTCLLLAFLKWSDQVTEAGLKLVILHLSIPSHRDHRHATSPNRIHSPIIIDHCVCRKVDFHILLQECFPWTQDFNFKIKRAFPLDSLSCRNTDFTVASEEE